MAPDILPGTVCVTATLPGYCTNAVRTFGSASHLLAVVALRRALVLVVLVLRARALDVDAQLRVEHVQLGRRAVAALDDDVGTHHHRRRSIRRVPRD